jgi:putative transposase
MNAVYRAAGTTKQNVHQRLAQDLTRQEERGQMKLVIQGVRRDHPEMGAKTLYTKLRPATMGRDRFFAWYRENGLTIVPRKNWRRTTDSSGVVRFPNRIPQIELNAVNQVWVSDITYYQIGDKFHYLTLVMDQYSRKIKGFSASQSLHTEATTIPAIKMALRTLKEGDKPIIHSDGGGQYYCKEFLDLTKGRLENSMGKSAYENPHAERLNRTIKNYYLVHYNPINHKELCTCLTRAVKMYNEDKPHQSLKGLTPNKFENQIQMFN